MKFESAFGIGEVVIMVAGRSPTRELADNIGRIIQVTFGQDATCVYLVEWMDRAGQMQRHWLEEPALIGDPDFDQETGYDD